MISFFFTLLFAVGCTNSSSDDVTVGPGSGSGSSGSEGTREFMTECGTVVNGSVQNPVQEENGEVVTIDAAASNNVVIIERGQGRQLVQLRALADSVSSFQSQRAFDIIGRFRGQALLYTDGCETTVQGGGLGIVGHLFSLGSGESLDEALVVGNAAEVTGSGSCSEALIAGCYQSLKDSVVPETGAAVSNFLWKPVSERDGNLVVLLNPGGATIVVNGSLTLTNTGPSNGRGTTARANRPGGAFGSNVRVEAFDSQGRPLVFPGGATSFTIANGSSRVEF